MSGDISQFLDVEAIEILKRPLMAKIGSNLCKKIYVTDDNPRNENPGKIRKEIIKNIKIKIVLILVIGLKL